MTRSIQCRRSSSSHKSYSSCSCIYKTGSERPAIRKLIADGSRFDELYLGNFLPLREKKLLNRLRKTRDAYDDAAIQSIYGKGCKQKIGSEYFVGVTDDDGNSIFSAIEMQDDDRCHILYDDQCSCLSCDSESNICKGFLRDDEHVKPGKLISKSSMCSHTLKRKAVQFKAKHSQSDPFTSISKFKKLHRFRSTHNKKRKYRPEPMLEPLSTFNDGIQPKDKIPLKRILSKETQGNLPMRKESMTQFTENVLKKGTNLKSCDCNCENCCRRLQDACLFEKLKKCANTSKTSMSAKLKKHSFKIGRKKDKKRFKTAEKKTSSFNSVGKKSSGSNDKIFPNSQFLLIDCDPKICGTQPCNPVVCNDKIQNHILRYTRRNKYHNTARTSTLKTSLDTDRARNEELSNDPKQLKQDHQENLRKSTGSSKSLGKRKIKHSGAEYKHLQKPKLNKKSSTSRTHLKSKFVTSAENVLPYECDSNICIPGECDPTNCEKIMGKITKPVKSRRYKTKSKSSKVQVKSDVNQKNTFSNNNSIKNFNKEKYQIRVYNKPSQTTLLKKKHRRPLSHKCICFKFGKNKKKATASGTTTMVSSISNLKKLKTSKAITSHLIRKSTSKEIVTPKENLSIKLQRSVSRPVHIHHKKPSTVEYFNDKADTSSLTTSLSKPIYYSSAESSLKISSKVSFNVNFSKNKAPNNDEYVSVRDEAIQHRKTKVRSRKISSSLIKDQSSQVKTKHIKKSGYSIITKNESSTAGLIRKRCFCTLKLHKVGRNAKNQTTTKLLNKGVYTPNKSLTSDASITKIKKTMMKNRKLGHKTVQRNPNKRKKNIAVIGNHSKDKNISSSFNFDEIKMSDKNIRYISDSLSSPQILKLSSHFSFNLEFSKNLFPLHHDTIKQQHIRTRNKEIGNRKTIDKTFSSSTRPVLKRCFCTLQLHKRDNVFHRKGPRNIYTVSRMRDTKQKIFREITKNKYFGRSQESIVVFNKYNVISKSCPFKYKDMQSYFREESAKVSQENIVKITRVKNKLKLANSEPYIIKQKYCNIDFTDNNRYSTTGINSFLKRCFCTMNMQLSNKKNKQSGFPQSKVIDNLKPYECEPNICVPGDCDPIECQKLIMIRLKKTPSPSVRLATPSPSVRLATPSPSVRLATKSPSVRLATKSPSVRLATKSPTSKCECETVKSKSLKCECETAKSGILKCECETTPMTESERIIKHKNLKTISSQTKQSLVVKQHSGSQPDFQKTASKGLDTLRERCFCTLKLHKTGNLEKKRKGDRLDSENKNKLTKPSLKNISIEQNSRPSKNTFVSIEKQNNILKTSNTQTKSDVMPFFKRCFCSLSLKRHIKDKNPRKTSSVGIDKKYSVHEEGNTQTASQDAVAKNNIRKSYKCEPGLCNPGKCNPHKCLQIIKKRQFENMNSNSFSTTKPTSATTAKNYYYNNKKVPNSPEHSKSFPSFRSEPSKSRHREYQLLNNHFETSQQVDTARIGSTFNFSVEFFKDKIPSFETSDGEKFSVHRKRNDSLVTHTRNIFDHRNNNLDNKKIGYSQTFSDKARAKIASINPFFKRCFCKLSSKNIKKSPKSIDTSNVGIEVHSLKPSIQSAQTFSNHPKIINRGLDAYECEPGVCMPSKCNPYQCVKRIKKVDRNLHRHLGTSSELDMKSVYSTADLPTYAHKKMQLNDQQRKLHKNAATSFGNRNVPRLSEQQIVLGNPLESSSRQAVRIESKLNFNIEFSKNKFMAKDESQKHENYRPHRQIKHHIYKGRNKNLTSTSSQITKKIGHKNIGNQGRVTPKKYVNMGTKPNKRYIRSVPQDSRDVQTFVPITGRSSVLTETDHLKLPKHQNRGSATFRKRLKNKSANNLTRRSHYKNVSQYVYFDKKRYQSKNNPNVNSDSQIRSSREAVRIGSSFSFNIEFYKDQTGVSNKVAEKNIPKQRLNEHYHKKTEILRPKRKERQLTSSITQTTVNRRVSSKVDTKGLVKRCFCILNLNRKSLLKKKKRDTRNLNVGTSIDDFTSFPRMYVKDVSLGSNECTPGISVPVQCDPYECFRQKYRDFGSLSKRHKVKSVFSVCQPYNYHNKKNQFNAIPRTKDFKTQYLKPKSAGSRKKIDKISMENKTIHPCSQAVKIGSSFSFNIELYKDKSPCGDAPIICKPMYKTTPENEMQIKNIKRPKNIATSRVQTLPYSNLNPKFNKGVDANRIIQYDISETQTFNDSKNNFNKMANKTNQCLPGICVAGQCDSYKCDVIKHNASVTAKRKGLSAYGIDNYKLQSHKKMQFNSFQPVSARKILIKKEKTRSKRNLNYPRTLDNQIHNATQSNQAVKVGSNFSFNVDFFKERPNKSIQYIPIKKQKKRAKIKQNRTEYAVNHTFLRRCLCLLKPRKNVVAQTKKRKFKTANSATETDKIDTRPKVNKAINVQNRMRSKDSPTKFSRKDSKYFSAVRRMTRNSKASMIIPYAKQCRNRRNYTCVIPYAKQCRNRRNYSCVTEKDQTQEFNCNRQAVRIGSSFNFSVEFYKNKWPICKKPCIEPPLKKVIKSCPYSCQKVPKMRNIETKIDSPKYIHRKSYVQPRGRKSVGQESATIYSNFKGQISPKSKNRDFKYQTPCGRHCTSQITPIKYVHRGAEGRLPKYIHRNSQMEPCLKRGKKSQIYCYKNRESQAKPIQRKDATGGDDVDYSHQQSQIVPRIDSKAVGAAEVKCYCTANLQTADGSIRETGVGTHKKCYCTANLQTAIDFVKDSAVGTHEKCYCTANLQTPGFFVREIAVGKDEKCYCTEILQTAGYFVRESAVGTHSIPRFPKLHKQTEIDSLLPYECEAGTCIPGECNPFECAERIKKRLRSQGMSTTPKRFSQASVVTKACTLITKSRGNKALKEVQFVKVKQPICLEECNVDYCCQDKQAVKIGSTFSFSVEFFKNINKRCNENSVQVSEPLPKKNKRNTKLLSRNSQAKKKLTDEKSAGVNNLVKRCFCTLKLNKNQMNELKWNNYRNNNKLVTVNRCDLEEFRNNKFVNKQYWVQYHTVHYNRHKAGGDQKMVTKSTATTLKQKQICLNTNICEPYDCNPYACKEPKCKSNILRYFQRKKRSEISNDDIETIYPYRPYKFKKYASQSLINNRQTKNCGNRNCVCANKFAESDRCVCNENFIVNNTTVKEPKKNRVHFSKQDKVPGHHLKSEEMLQNTAKVAGRNRMKKSDRGIPQNKMQTDNHIRQYTNQSEANKKNKGKKTSTREQSSNRNAERSKRQPPHPNKPTLKKNEIQMTKRSKQDKRSTYVLTYEEKLLEKKLRKERMKERRKLALHYNKQDEWRVLNRIKRDREKNKRVPKYKHHNPASLVVGSIVDLATLGVRAFADVFRITYRKIKHRKYLFPSSRSKHEMANISDKQLKLHTTCRTAGGAGTFYRIRKRLIEIPFITRVAFVITNMRGRRRRHIQYPGCNLFLETLRQKPCLWVYDICPWFYPHCLSLLAAWRQFSDIMLFLLAILVWCPCILCVEFCRAILCCFVCTQ